ncbi:MAG: OB-fold nucleic acid binding domain-containing protein [Nanoarchaeota archaeon]
MAAATIERQTAQVTTIGAIIGGANTKAETHLQPKYVHTGKEMNRIHIIAVVVSISEGTAAEAILDDGTGRIAVRSFENPAFFEKVQLGDIVRVIGKVRAFNEQGYIIPEIMKRIQNRQFVTLHKLLLQSFEKNTNVQTTQPVAEMHNEQQSQQSEEVEEIPVDADDTIPDSPFDELLALIKKLDKGDGAQVEEIIGQSEENSEKMIQNLLEAGEVFEIRPGRIKVLE